MSNTVSSKIDLSIHTRQVLSDGLEAGTISEKFLVSLDLKNGATSGKIDAAYSAQATAIAASTTTSIDLVAGINDPFGTAISFATVNLIAIRNLRSTAGAYLDVGPHATHGFGLSETEGPWIAALGSGGGNRIGPSGWFVFYSVAGVACTGGESDILATITSAIAGSTNSWDLVVLGQKV